MEILVLGSGCKNCKALEANVREALKQLGKEVEVKKVTDMVEIVSFGVMSTPALVVDNKIVVSGRVPGVDELKELL